MMKLSVTTNFDDKLIEELKKYPVYEVYGKLQEDYIGGGRPSNTLKSVDKTRLEEHIKKVRDSNIKFNYLLNGACLANKEQDVEWQKNVREFLDYLKEIGVNALTVTNPFLLQIIKKYYDCFTVRISTFACIDSYEKARYWEEMGADYICVDFVKINRDFKTLKYMVDNLKKAKIELLMTNSCLKNCPYIHTHTAALSHASNIMNKDKECYADWCLYKCQEYELKHVEEYIKSPWIRPEDVKEYEKIGVEHFKITERDFPTNEIIKRVKAYSEGKYDGNLLDLIQGQGWSNSENDNNTIKNIDDFTSMNEIIKEICNVRGLGCERRYKRHIYIDNRKLDGFIKFFKDGHCTGNCLSCNYCKTIADKVIVKNDEICNYLEQLYDKFNEAKF